MADPNPYRSNYFLSKGIYLQKDKIENQEKLTPELAREMLNAALEKLNPSLALADDITLKVIPG